MNHYQPPSPPPMPGSQASYYSPESEQDRDKRALKTLSILHYVYGGLSFVGLLFMILHYLIFSSVIGAFDEGFSSAEEWHSEQVIVTSDTEDSPSDEVLGDLPEDVQDILKEQGVELQQETSEDQDGDGVVTVRNEQTMSEADRNFFSSLFSAFVYLYVIFGLLFVAVGVMNIISARLLARQRGMVFSQITAGINCIQIPLGLILGIFTFVTLSKGSVHHLYRNH